MNSIDIRTEKANVIFRYRSIQRIANLFRFMEICVFIVVILTFLSQFSISVRIPVDHFRGISFESVSPKLVFVIGNVIILILLFKSRVAENGDRYGRIDVYEECVKRCEKGVVNCTNDIVEANEIQERKIRRSQSEKMMTVECKDSQTHRKMTSSFTERKILKGIDCSGGEKPAPEICRSQSEKMMRIKCTDSESHRKVTSSVTEGKILKGVDCFGGKTPVPEICRSQSEKMMRIERTDTQSRRKVTSSVTERKILKGVDCFGGKTPTPAPEIYRSQSEKMMRVECTNSESRRKLRRSVTEGKMLKNGGCCGGDTPPPLPERCGVDELSSEAFRRTVEAFIERQQRSLRDEELAPVTYVGE